MLDLLRLNDTVLRVVLCHLVDEDSLPLHLPFGHGISGLPFELIALTRCCGELERLGTVFTRFILILVAFEFFLAIWLVITGGSIAMR
jgi:hypothetical protein